VTRPTTAARILVLLPSLALLRQTLHEWLRETRLPSLVYLCVCSDPTVKEGIDALTTQQSDLDFQVSTDAASVRCFLDARFPAEDDFLHLPIRVRGGRGDAAGRGV
jgi:predicted helicase